MVEPLVVDVTLEPREGALHLRLLPAQLGDVAHQDRVALCLPVGQLAQDIHQRRDHDGLALGALDLAHFDAARRGRAELRLVEGLETLDVGRSRRRAADGRDSANVDLV